MSDEKKNLRPELVERTRKTENDPEFRRLRNEVMGAIRRVANLVRKNGRGVSTAWVDFMPAGAEGDPDFNSIVLREQAKIEFDPDLYGAVIVRLRSNTDREIRQLRIFLDTKTGEVRPPVRGMEYKGKLAMCVGVLSGIQSPLPKEVAILERMFAAIEESGEAEPEEAESAALTVDERPAAGDEETGAGELALEPAAVDVTAGNGEDKTPAPEKKVRLRKDGKPYGSPKDEPALAAKS